MSRHVQSQWIRRLDDLTRDDRIFVIRIDRTEAMIAIGNEDLAMDWVPDEQERR